MFFAATMHAASNGRDTMSAPRRKKWAYHVSHDPPSVRQARRLFEQGHSNAARQMAEAVLAAQPDNVDAMILLAVMAQARGDHAMIDRLAQAALALRPDDRFLLCSDGLTRVVPESEIRNWMQSEDIHTAVDGLIKATLNAGAPDNVTVLIAEVHA